jgi:serine phosphatase RsbU (regulator of sigma subunit)/pSer/pThr/pTyr-binding forkhead associated (FHA) protein
VAFLRKLDGTQTYPLKPRLTLIGREAGCDIAVADNQISSRHAIVVNEGGRHSIEDLRSLNGTLVNGKPIAGRMPLAPGDRLEFPGLIVTFHDVSATGASGRTAVVIAPSRPANPADIVEQPSVVTSLDVGARARPEVAPEAKLRAMIEITDALGTTLALDKVLPRILESLFTIFPKATRGFILLRDRNTGKLVPKAVHLHDDTAAPPRLSMTVVDQAVATGKAILTVDAGRDVRFNASESIRHLKLQSIMCVPMVSPTGDVVGVIQIDTVDSTGIFGQEDLDVLLSASMQAARAIELARLHEELRDLEAANRIQHSFLPDGPPHAPGLAFYDHYSPARQVGGDYYDYIPLPGNRLAVTLGDVAGKGIAAALQMARLSAAARFCLATTPSVPDAVWKLNRDLARTFGDDRFASFLVAVIDLAQFGVTLVNAGHIPPLRCRPGKAPEPIGEENAGLPLAGIDWTYKATTLTLEPGEAFIFYTDGVSEARNPEGELYGPDRLHTVVRQNAGSVEAMGSAILADVKRFAAGRPPCDDLTLVCFGRP